MYKKALLEILNMKKPPSPPSDRKIKPLLGNKPSSPPHKSSHTESMVQPFMYPDNFSKPHVRVKTASMSGKGSRNPIKDFEPRSFLRSAGTDNKYSMLKKNDVVSPNRSEVSEGRSTAYCFTHAFGSEPPDQRERAFVAGPLHSDVSDGINSKFFKTSSGLGVRRKKNYSVDLSGTVGKQ